MLKISIAGIACALLSVASLQAQVQWASKVLEVSSERKQDPAGEGYGAIQALGAPNKLPALGESPCAWSPSKPDGRFDEWITVGFDNPMPIVQVAVAENFGAGAITRIVVYGEGDRMQVVYSDKINPPLGKTGRLLRAVFAQTPFAVTSVKVVLSTVDVPGWNQIDAIGISSSAEPIQARIQEAEPIATEYIEPLSRYINSEAEEVVPIVSPDGGFLYFVRKNYVENLRDENGKPLDDIWVAEKQGGGWSIPKHLSAPLNTQGSDYVCAVTPDGNTLLLGNEYLPGGRQKVGVSVTHKTAEGWAFPKALNIKNFYNWSNTAEYFLANNGKILLMAVQRKDSEGRKDLYVSFLREDEGEWSEPMRTGGQINSPADELSPFLASDNKTLYFCSEGFAGYGKTDIYVTRRLDSTWTNWSEPLNLGKAFNSAEPDVSFTLDAQGEFAYFATGRQNADGNSDLFRAKLPKDARPEKVVIVSGTVYNDKTKQPLGAKILYESLVSGMEVGIAYSDPTSGTYKITLPLHESYGFFASSNGFLSINDNIDLNLSADTSVYEIKRDLHLVPFEVGQTITLNNLFFKQSMAEMLPSSYPELRRLAETMTAHPNMEIVLEGHTDIQGNPGLNMKLSEERVEAVKAFLVEQGVHKKRIDTKGLGDTQPITRNRDEASRKRNRRVEVRIVKF